MNDTAGKSREKTPWGMRTHLALTYLAVIWITLLVVTVSVSHFQVQSSLQAKKTHLYAQAHLMARTIEARGGPGIASVSTTGGVPSGGRVLVIDHLGRVAEDSAMDPAMNRRDLTKLTEVSQAMAGVQVANTYHLPNKSFVLYLAVPAPWEEGTGAIFISQSLQDIKLGRNNLMKVVFVGGGLASFAALGLAWFLTRLVAGPISELAGIAKRMSSGRLDLRVKPRGPEETKALANSFNSMAEGIEKVLKTQEEFLLAALHEIRSPLAALSVLVESMQINPPEERELPEFLQDMKGELDRLVRTAEGILDLLRLTEPPDEKRVNPLGELRAVVENLGAYPEHRGRLNLSYEGSVGDTFAVNPTDFRLIATNLIDNALKYSEQGSPVDIRCHTAAGNLVLSVKDRGVGISRENIPRLFERFYRTDPSRTKSTGGAGLGLAIVKEACERSKAEISVESKPGLGSVFTITWVGNGDDEISYQK